MKIKELYSDESRWTQHCLTRDITGIPIVEDYEGAEATVNHPKAYCFCLYGAAVKCYPKRLREMSRLITTTLGLEAGTPIYYWNDDPKRTFEEIKELVERLDI